MAGSPLFADLMMARRLEAAEAQGTADCARHLAGRDPTCGTLETAGGLAISVGRGSPLNKCSGMGLHGRVSAEELNRAEEFFRPDGKIVIDLCPLADQSLIDLLRERGYGILEVENVLVRSLRDGLPPDDGYGRDVEVRPARDEEARTWATIVGQGFAGDAPVSEEAIQFGLSFFGAGRSRPYLAFVDGEAAAGGGMGVRDGLVSLFGAATLPQFRNRGVQTAMIRRRLEAARGCDLARTCTRPGSTSQRNAERLGFRVMYTKPQLVRTLSA
jgi:ribosomal protein S18 acetylase RimI-like enzyme